jgi:hypothetical protein
MRNTPTKCARGKECKGVHDDPLAKKAHNVCHIVAMSLVGKRIAMIGPTTSAEESYFGCIPAPNASNRIKPHHTEEQEKDRKGGRGRGGDLAQ